MGSISDERVFSEVKRPCCAGLDALDLLREAVGCMRRAVPFEAYCASTTDPASGLITHGQYEEMGGEEEAALFFDRHYFDHQVDRLGRMARERRPVELLSEEAGGRLECSPYYREMLVPLGYTYRALSVFTTGGAIWGSMDLARAAGCPDFDIREVALLKRLAPHMGIGLKTAALRSQASPEEKNVDMPGVLTLDLRGRVIQHTPIAEYWLREIEDLAPGWQENIPTAVRMISSALRRSLRPETDNDLNSVPRLRVRARSGRWLTLYGSLTDATLERSVETVIVIEPTKPEEILPFNMVAYGLSPREESVVNLVLRGLSTVQISQKLFISEYTVQNHLRSVFEKVSVRSRRDLVKRLFFDNLYPSLFA